MRNEASISVGRQLNEYILGYLNGPEQFAVMFSLGLALGSIKISIPFSAYLPYGLPE